MRTRHEATAASPRVRSNRRIELTGAILFGKPGHWMRRRVYLTIDLYKQSTRPGFTLRLQ